MAIRKSASITRDANRRRIYNINELKRQSFLSIYHNRHMPASIRQRAMEELQKMDRNSSLTRIKRRCVVSGRNRGVLRRYKLSRLVFRREAVQGNIPGVFKASW
jgi:ribosomal protein S14